MPKDQTLNTMLRESMTSPQEQAAHQSNHSNSDHGNKPSSRSDIDALMQRLSMKVEGSQIDGELQERKGKDLLFFQITHGFFNIPVKTFRFQKLMFYRIKLSYNFLFFLFPKIMYKL